MEEVCNVFYHHFPDLNLFTVIGGVSIIGGILALSVAVGCMVSRIRDKNI